MTIVLNYGWSTVMTEGEHAFGHYIFFNYGWSVGRNDRRQKRFRSLHFFFSFGVSRR